MAGIYTPDFLEGVFEESEDEDNIMMTIIIKKMKMKRIKRTKSQQWCISHLLKSKRKRVVILKQIKVLYCYIVKF